MAKIIFATLPGTSHLGASIFIGRQLMQAGHEILWLCVESDRQKISDHQLKTLPILTRSVPADYRERMRSLNAFARLRARFRMLAGVFSEIHEDLHRILDEQRPDLMILDATAQPGAFIPLARGVPVVLMSTTLPTTREGDLPPLSSLLPPPRNEAERRRIAKLWRRTLLKKRLKTELLSLRHARKLAKRNGYPWSRVNTDDLFTFDLPLPKMILCSEGFDFPCERRADLHYVGPCIDLERDGQVDLDLPGNRKLVYCALTTMDAFVGPVETVRFFQTVIQAFAQLPEFELLLSTSRFPFHPENLPENVRVVAHAPQISVLKHARLMITHGGLNSIKEALVHGVPMIAFPLAVDQPGNVARLTYHGLGYFAGRIREATVDGIREQVLALDRDDGVRSRAAAMSQRFLADQAAQRPLELVKRMLTAPSASPNT